MKRVYTLNEREFRRLVNSEVRRLVESGRSRSWLLEDADPTKIDDNRFPLTLSAVDLEKAKKLVNVATKSVRTRPCRHASI